MSVTKKCMECNKVLVVGKFAKNPYVEDGYDFWCKSCRRKKVKNELTLKQYLFENDRPYSISTFRDCLSKSAEKNKKKNITDNDRINLDATRMYFQRIPLMGTDGDGKQLRRRDLRENVRKEAKNKDTIKHINKKAHEPGDRELAEKWGYEFDSKDLSDLEGLYQDMKLSFVVESASQEDYLKKICMASVKSDKALREGKANDAKKWIDVYDDLMRSAKMAPVQASAADSLGVNTFSEFTEMIEKQGFIPSYPDVPQDDLDWALLCFINYNRKLVKLNEIDLDESKEEINKIKDELKEEIGCDNYGENQ